MSIRIQLHRTMLSLALCGLIGGAAIATAGEVARDETRIAVRTQSGAIEKITVLDIDAFAPNETRPFTTDSGNAATLTRTDSGVTLALAGERFDIALPRPGDEEAGLPGGERIVIRKHLDERHVAKAGEPMQRKVIVRHGEAEGAQHADKRVVIRHGEGIGVPEDLAAMELALEDDAMLLADGKSRIAVVRRVHKHADPVQ